MDTEVISVEEFQRRVLAHIAQADKDARQLFKELTAPPKKKRKRRKPLTKRQIAYRTQTCQKCGTPWEDINPSCKSCYVRHYERRNARTKKANA